MTDISSMQNMLNWRLLKGSHKFPGSDGGTCINEAAIVAAGFEYKAVSGVKDLPECFCPYIGQHLIFVNDLMDSKHRQELIKYIPLMPGSRVRNDYVKYDEKFYQYLDSFIAEIFGEFYTINIADEALRLSIKNLTKAAYRRTKNKSSNLYETYTELLASIFVVYANIKFLTHEKLNINCYNESDQIYTMKMPKYHILCEHFTPIILNQIDRLFDLNMLYRDEPPIEVERVRDNINAFRKEHNLETI